MSELRNNIYAFSQARFNDGEILISRTRHGDAEGENIFKHLQISRDEQEFLRLARQNDLNKPVIVLGHRFGEERAILIFGLSALESSLYLAVEMLSCPKGVLRALLTAKELPVAISDAVRHAAQRESENDYTADAQEGLSLAEALNFSRFLADKTGEGSELLEITLAVAEFVRLLVECDEVGFSNFKPPINHVCAYGFFSATMMILSLSARKYSKQRKMTVTVTEHERFGSVNVSFEAFFKPREAIEKHLCTLATRLGLPMSVSATGNHFCVEITPYIPDSGKNGTKESEKGLVYDGFSHLGINKVQRR